MRDEERVANKEEQPEALSLASTSLRGTSLCNEIGPLPNGKYRVRPLPTQALRRPRHLESMAKSERREEVPVFEAVGSR